VVTHTAAGQSWWDRLTDADLDQVAGQKEQLVRAVEARYGYARERAEQEVDRHLAEFYKTLETSHGSRLMEAASSTAHGIASTLTKTAGEANTAQKIAATAATSMAILWLGQVPTYPNSPVGWRNLSVAIPYHRSW
jgi:hypothetical protein